MEKNPITFEQLPSFVYELGRKIDQLYDLLNQPVNSSNSQDEVLTIGQAAQLLNLTTQTIYGMVGASKIPYSKPTGGRLYFSKLALLDWLKEHRTTTIKEVTDSYNQQRPIRCQPKDSNRRAA